MVSKAKLYRQLDRLEEELWERIVPHLEKATIGQNDLIFCVTDFNPFPQLKFKTDTETELLIQIARQILGLTEKLGEPSEGSIADRICWYCRIWGSTGDSHGKIAQGLAGDFLEEIMNIKTKK
jgi:hypothetical protein